MNNVQVCVTNRKTRGITHHKMGGSETILKLNRNEDSVYQSHVFIPEIFYVTDTDTVVRN